MRKILLATTAMLLLAPMQAMAADDVPLVILSGKIQRIPNGDNLKVPSISGVTQCLHANSSGVITGTGTDCGSGSGSVGTTGSPANGNLAKFTGAATISNADLTGDCTTSGGVAVTCANMAKTNANNTFTKAQRCEVQTISPSSNIYTPDFDDAQCFSLTLAATNTVANPSTTPVAGQSGVFEIIQDGTGGRTITWGSQYYAAGGVATLVLSTGIGAKDYLSYFVADATHIIVSLGVLNATH